MGKEINCGNHYKKNIMLNISKKWLREIIKTEFEKHYSKNLNERIDLIQDDLNQLRKQCFRKEELRK